MFAQSAQRILACGALLLLGCLSTTAEQSPAPQSEDALVPSRDPHPGPSQDEVRAIVERLGLLEEMSREEPGERGAILESFQLAELTGQGQRELVVYLFVYVGEGCWTGWYVAIQLDGPSGPVRLGEPLASGGYRDPGYLEPRDLDGDGRQELILVGDTSGDSPSELSIWSWSGDGDGEGEWSDLLWESPCGVSYIPFDLRDDGDEELVGLLHRYDDGDTIVEVAVLDHTDGLYRAIPADRLPPAEAWIPRLAMVAYSDESLHRPHLTLPLVADLLIQRRQLPSDRDQLLPLLERQLTETTEPWQGRPWLTAMASLRTAEANAVLARLARTAVDADMRRWAMFEWTLRASDADVSRALELLEQLLSDSDTPLEPIRGGLEALRLRGVDLGAELLVNAVRSSSLARERRAELLVEFFPPEPRTAPALLEALESGEPTMEVAAGQALRRIGQSIQGPEQAWRESLDENRLLAHARHPNRQVQLGVLWALERLRVRQALPIYIELLRTPASQPDRDSVLHLAFISLSRFELEREQTAALVSLLEAFPEPGHRTRLHVVIARSDDPRLLAEALAHVRDGRELEPYGRRLSADVGRRRGANWRPVRIQLLRLLGRGEPRIRQHAVKALVGFRGPDVREAIRERFRRDEVVFVRSEALRALARMGDVGADSMLIEWLESPAGNEATSSYLRSEAMQALGQLATERAGEWVEAALTDDRLRQYEYSLLRGLSLRGDVPAVALMREHSSSLLAANEVECDRLLPALRARLALRYSAGPRSRAGLALTPALDGDLDSARQHCSVDNPAWLDIIRWFQESEDQRYLPLLRRLEDSHEARRVRGASRAARLRLTRVTTR